MITKLNPDNMTSGLFAAAVEWFYATQSKAYVTVEVSDPEFTSTPMIPMQHVRGVDIVYGIPVPDGIQQKTATLRTLVLNIGPDAIERFEYFPDGFSFSVRFNTVPHVIYVPYTAVMTLHNPDTGKVWSAEHTPVEMRSVVMTDNATEMQFPPAQAEAPKPRANHLQRVK